MGRLRAALVEPSAAIRAQLTHSMRASKIDVQQTGLSELEACLSAAEVDVVIAAWTPTEQIAVVDIVRPRWTTPILLYTTETCSHSQRASVIDGGVDDVIVDALAGIDELVARVKAMHRRVSGASLTRLKVGLVEIDFARRAALVDGVRIDPTANEFTVLAVLAARAPKAVSKAELSYALGYRDASQSHTLKQTVMRLRAKLGCAAAQIKAVIGFGYLLDVTGQASVIH